MHSEIRQELIRQMDQLPMDLQLHLLDYIRKLSGHGLQGSSGKDLLAFSGTFTSAEAKRLAQAIQEGCQQVDLNEW